MLQSATVTELAVMQESVVCGIVLPVLACNNWESFLVKSKEGVNQLCEDCLNMWQ